MVKMGNDKENGEKVADLGSGTTVHDRRRGEKWLGRKGKGKDVEPIGRARALGM